MKLSRTLVFSQWSNVLQSADLRANSIITRSRPHPMHEARSAILMPHRTSAIPVAYAHVSTHTRWRARTRACVHTQHLCVCVCVCVCVLSCASFTAHKKEIATRARCPAAPVPLCSTVELTMPSVEAMHPGGNPFNSSDLVSATVTTTTETTEAFQVGSFLLSEGVVAVSGS
jgi:hypothetical protein